MSANATFWRNVAALLAFFGLVYALLAKIALHAFPFSGDEYSYFLQAELFARGLLHAPAPPHAELLRVDHVLVDVDSWVRSKYPPGTSALLALGVRAGAPWLVTPVEGVVTLLATAIGAKRVLGDRDALISVAMLGAAPLFAFQAASFYAHTATTMWLAIALAGIAIWSEDGRDWPLPLAGMAIGCALLTRPLDAVLFSVALLSLWSLRVVVGVGLGAAPFGALSLLYNRAQFGSPFRDGYRAYSATMGSIYGPREMVRPVSLSHLVDGEQIYNHLDILRGLVVDWTVPGTALLALLGWVALRDVPRTRAVRRFLAVLTVLFALVLFVSFGGPDDGARPRYLSTLLLPLAWFAGPGWRSVAEFLRKRLGGGLARSVVVAAWLLAPLELGAFLYVRTPQLWIREGLAQAVEAAGIERATIVVLAEYPSRYTRNGPFFDRAVLYVSPQLATDLDEIAQVFPGRPVYEAHEGKKWSLVRVR